MKTQFRRKYMVLAILLVLSLTVLISCDSDNTSVNQSSVAQAGTSASSTTKTNQPSKSANQTKKTNPTEAKTTQPETTQPQTTQPKTTQPQTTQPQTTQPITEPPQTAAPIQTPEPTPAVTAAPAETIAPQPQEEPIESYVWIPRTGKKYHSNSNCSNMKQPRQVSISEAKSLGYEPCKKCY